MSPVVKFSLIAFVIIYIGVVYFWRIYSVWKKTGIWPVTYGGARTAHDLVGKVFAVLVGLSIANTVIYVASPAIYAYLLPLRWLETMELQITGLVAAWLSMAWTVLAQHQMGTDWRIGIDRCHPTTLVRAGLFRLSRHPIYLGVAATSASLFLAIPNLVSLGTLVGTAISVAIQARLEEEHMQQVHGTAYDAFAGKTRRWL